MIMLAGSGGPDQGLHCPHMPEDPILLDAVLIVHDK